MAGADVGRRRSESESGDRDGVLGIRSRWPAPRVLAHERSKAERTVGAVVASGQAGRRRSVVVARSGCGRVWITPGLAQQGGVLPHGQGQHDRHGGCSKDAKHAPTGANSSPTVTACVRPYFPHPGARRSARRESSPQRPATKARWWAPATCGHRSRGPIPDYRAAGMGGIPLDGYPCRAPQ